MSPHDRYQSALNKPENRLGAGWQPRPTQKASMPRQHRSLLALFRDWFGEEFWPTDAADWSLCKWLACLDLALLAFLAFSILNR